MDGRARRAVRDDNFDARELHAAFGNDLAGVAVHRRLASDRGAPTGAEGLFARAVLRRFYEEVVAYAVYAAFGQHPATVSVEDQWAAAPFARGRLMRLWPTNPVRTARITTGSATRRDRSRRKPSILQAYLAARRQQLATIVKLAKGS